MAAQVPRLDAIEEFVEDLPTIAELPGPTTVPLAVENTDNTRTKPRRREKSPRKTSPRKTSPRKRNSRRSSKKRNLDADMGNDADADGDNSRSHSRSRSRSKSRERKANHGHGSTGAALRINVSPSNKKDRKHHRSMSLTPIAKPGQPHPHEETYQPSTPTGTSLPGTKKIPKMDPHSSMSPKSKGSTTNNKNHRHRHRHRHRARSTQVSADGGSKKTILKTRTNRRSEAQKSSAKPLSLLFDAKFSVDIKGKLQTFYKVKEKLGVGTYSTVRRGVRRSDNCNVAIKVLRKMELGLKEMEMVKREAEIMKSLDHDNIIQLIDLFESDHHIYIISELCTGGELFDHLLDVGYFSEQIAQHIIKQIVSAIAYMHSSGIIHRDLKPENLLVVDRESLTPRGPTAPTEPATRQRSSSKASTPRLEAVPSPDIPNQDLDQDIEEKLPEPAKKTPPKRRNTITALSAFYKGNPAKASHSGSNLLSIASPNSSSVISHLTIKVSDFGLAKRISIPKNGTITNADNEEKSNDDDNARQIAMTTFCGTLYYVAPEILEGKPYGKAVDCWSIGIILYTLLCGNLPFFSESEPEVSVLIKKGKFEMSGQLWDGISGSAKELISNLLILDPTQRYTVEQIQNHPFITGKATPMRALSISSKWKAKFSVLTRLAERGKETRMKLHRRMTVDKVLGSFRNEETENSIELVTDVSDIELDDDRW